MIIDDVDVHCQYCMCPAAVWKHSMKSYDGDQCKLYDDFQVSFGSLKMQRSLLTIKISWIAAGKVLSMNTLT